MEYSEAVLKNEVALHELARRDVHGKGLSGKQKPKKTPRRAVLSRHGLKTENPIATNTQVLVKIYQKVL